MRLCCSDVNNKPFTDLNLLIKTEWLCRTMTVGAAFKELFFQSAWCVSYLQIGPEIGKNREI